MRAWILSGVVASIVSVGMFQFLGSRCFVKFDVTDDFQEVLHGNVGNLITDLGIQVMAVFLYGCFVLASLGAFVSWRVRRWPKSEAEAGAGAGAGAKVKAGAAVAPEDAGADVDVDVVEEGAGAARAEGGRPPAPRGGEDDEYETRACPWW